MSSAKTAQELQEDFLDACRFYVDYWAKEKGLEREDFTGLMHSMLALISGVSSGFPCALDLVCRPHPEDKSYHQSVDEDWIEDGTVINANDMLHQLLYTKEWR